MPHKFNTSRRHKFAKKKYRVTNWCGYNESLRNRGDLTVWITGDARKHWAAPRRRSRGGQPRYSDLAITMCLNAGHGLQVAAAPDPRADTQHIKADAAGNFSS